MSGRRLAPLAALALGACSLGAAGLALFQTPPATRMGAVSFVGPSPFQTYATPAAMAAARGAQGQQAWVSNQGPWFYETTCPSTCDGTTTCVTAGGGDGGLGCWVRGSGIPGAQNGTTFYVDSTQGNDANACTASGANACATMDEIWRRACAGQLIPPNTTFAVNLAGDFSTQSLTMNCSALGGAGSNLIGYFFLVGQRAYVDGGTYKVQSYTAWNGSGHQEGVAYVTATDGGAGFDPATINTANGYMLEDETTNAGLGIIIGDKVDAGTFSTPGGSVVQSYANVEPSAGDTVKLYTLTKIATAANTSVSFYGNGNPVLENIQLGNGPHSIQMVSAPSTGNATLEFDACIVNGIDIAPSTYVTSWGSAFIGNTHLFGYWQGNGSAQIGSTFEVRYNGFAAFLSNELLSNAMLRVGCDLGSGEAWIMGPAASTAYTAPALHTCSGKATVTSTGYYWMHNTTANSIAIQDEASSFVTYASGHAPAITGSAGVWQVNGVITDGGLPQTNGLAGIVVQQ